MEEYRHIKQFMAPEEVRHFNDLIQQNAILFTETAGRGTLGPLYRVIDGDQIHSEMSEIEACGDQLVRPATEQFAGEPLRPMVFSKRSMGVLLYEKKHHGFRWHFDGHSYAALLCLKNTNRGQTHVISPRLSQFLRFLFYPLYAVPKVFSIMPHKEITMEQGDLLIIRGGRALHRGVTLDEKGERLLMVYAFDELDKKPNPLRNLRDKIARALNY